MSLKFGKTKETEGLLKLTKFGVATLIFGDIRPPTMSREATEIRQSAIQYVDDTSLRTNAQPAGDALASSECIIVSSYCC